MFALKLEFWNFKASSYSIIKIVFYYVIPIQFLYNDGVCQLVVMRCSF